MERQKMKKKGFTLVELLVVIAIIAMLLAILMPALGKVKQLAQRIMCSTNLSGIGKAMVTYSNDDKYESFPIGGTSGAYWDRGSVGVAGVGGTCSFEWRDPKAFPEAAGTTFKATLSSCLYLLVKFADVSPDQFICPGSDQKKFDLSKYDTATYSVTLTDVWDTGAKANEKPTGSGIRGKGHNSYSYELPLPINTGTQKNYVHPITSTSNPAKAIMADRNPFWQAPMTGSTARTYQWDTTSLKIVPASIPAGNSTYHQKDGQNVLYVDQHAKFEKIANCGLESDNIYTVWNKATLTLPDDEPIRQCGHTYADTTTPPNPTIQTDDTWCPQNDSDNYLVSDVDSDT